MINFISILFVLMMTSFSMSRIFARRASLSRMTGMMIAMTMGMMPSVTLGVVLGVLLPSILSLATCISILFGMGTGFIAGQPVSPVAALEGVVAGIMGGMMGPMVGMMLMDGSDSMILFLDLVFMFTMAVLIQIVNKESKTSING